MAKSVRFYESEQQAKEAVDKLKEIGLSDKTIELLTPEPGSEESSVRASIEAGMLPATQINVATQALRNGRSILTVELPYGAGQRVDDILASFNPVDTDKLATVSPSNPAPLSDFFGIPTLVHGASRTRLLQGPKDRSMGLPLLTRGGRPMFGVKLKPFRKNSSMGFKLLTDGKPMFPVKLLKHR